MILFQFAESKEHSFCDLCCLDRKKIRAESNYAGSYHRSIYMFSVEKRHRESSPLGCAPVQLLNFSYM